MKSIKNKLIASVAMLVVATVMMTSASFAWFTVSTAPEVQKIEVEMTAVKNLEIAKADADKTAPPEVTTGQGTDENAYGASITSFPKVTLTSMAKVDGNTIKTVSYSSTGRVDALVEATAPADDTLSADGTGKYSYTATINGKSADLDVAAVYGVWLRSNVAQTVTMNVTGADGFNTAIRTVVGGADTHVKAITSEANTFSLSADTDTLVWLIFYVDGENKHAADVTTNLTASSIKVTFTGSNTQAPAFTAGT